MNPDDWWEEEDKRLIPVPEPEEGDPNYSPPSLVRLMVHYRDMAGMTQQQLADRSGVNQSNISQIEGGHVPRPQTATIVRLATALAAGMAERARHGHHTLSAEDIVKYLTEARDNKPSPHGLVDGLVTVNAMLMPYPRWFRTVAIEAIISLIASMDKIYSRKRSL